MMNVVVPMVGTSQFFDDAQYKFPKPLIEVSGKTMIELFFENFKEIDKDINYIFIVNKDDCRKFHLDNILNILTSEKCEIIKIGSPTKGAACSVLMAIESINNNTPLIIANSDQYLDISINNALIALEKYDAGVITFKSIHPRWSFVKLNEKNEVIETAEKKPISNEAIAGFYYFSSGEMFVHAAMEMIKKDSSVNNLYYISPVYNELILTSKKLGVYHIESKNYHTFYNPQKIKEYERSVECQ